MVKRNNSEQATVHARPALEQIWAWLRDVCDPEISVLSVIDLGIVRNVEWNEDNQTCTITITPTYSGCPAVAVIESRIREELGAHGIAGVEVQTRLSPPWTTGWLSPQARTKLRHSGIAPPAADFATTILPLLDYTPSEPLPECPHCGSSQTSFISQFGSTICKALCRCQECHEPFEYFKQH